MKNIIYIILLFSLSNLLKAQHCSENINTITTDWRVGGSPNQWNWTQEFFETYIKNRTNPVVVRSPFYPGITGQNPNLLHFYTAYSNYGIEGLDFHPEDGWELLLADLGECCTNANAVTNPFFALYNRFTSTIRAFIMITEVPTSPQNGAIINFYISSTDRESAILTHHSSIAKPISDFAIDVSMETPNYYVNELDFWLYADFPVAYDPCICNYESTIRFEFKLIEQANITLEGSIDGTVTQIINSSPGNVNDFHVTASDLIAFCNIGSDYDIHSSTKVDNEITMKTQSSENYLYDIYPNPFKTDTRISYSIKEEETPVRIFVIDIMGNEVAEIVNINNHKSGKFEVNLQVSELSPGFYFCNLQAGNYFKTKRMVKIK